MGTTFEYLERVVVEAQIDIDNIGDCALLCRNDIGEEFYFLTKSYMGFVEVLEYGPCTPDLDILPFNVQLNYDRFEYSQYKLEKRIDKFLNNPKRAITQAEVSTVPKILQSIRHIPTVMFSDYPMDEEVNIVDDNEEIEE